MRRITEQIINLLHSGENITADQLAAALGVSEKTIRKYIAEAKEELHRYGAQIHSKQGCGYRMEIINEEAFSSWYYSLHVVTEKIPVSPEERVSYILAFLLNSFDYVRIDDLCEFLYISHNTLSADLKQVEYILQLYHLKVKRRPNYGICVEGSEFDRRRCTANCLIKRNNFGIKGIRQNDCMREVSNIFIEVLKNRRLRFSDDAFESMVIHIYVAKSRIARGWAMVFDERSRREIDEKMDDSIRLAVEDISEKIYEKMSVSWSEDEKRYLYIHLSGKISSDSLGSYGGNRVISSNIDELVLKMLKMVYETNKLDFRGNLELRMSLNQHLVPFDIRMRYGIPLRNPFLDQVKKEYTFAYTVAACACTVLKQYYQKEIPEDEIGYIAILFALAIEKRDRQIQKKNIVVVCTTGRGSAQLFMYKYKQAFGKYIDHIYESSAIDLEQFDFQGKKIDYVFTTVPIYVALPVPVFEISLFMDGNEVGNYCRMFEQGDAEFLYHYFDKRLFLPHLQANTKEDALEQMCRHIRLVRPLPDDFYDSVMTREQMGQTDFGNLVAIPHPCQLLTEEKFVMTAILEHPVWWGHNDVQVIMLISLSKEEDEDIEKFYMSITEFMSSKIAVNQLIRQRDFDTLLHLLGA